MRALLTSDLHGNLPEIPECDLLIIAGDICPDFMSVKYFSARIKADNGHQRQGKWLKNTFVPYLEALPVKDIVLIAGNHDFVFEQAFLLPEWPENVHYLQDSEVTIGGLRIWGTPWVPNLKSWAFYGGQGGINEKYLDIIPEGIDILVTHGPPWGYGDSILDGTMVGCINQGGMLYRVKPRVVVCGHIHEGFGWYRHPDVKDGIWNVAYVDEMYKPRDMVEDFEF